VTAVYFVNRFYHPDTSATAQVLRELVERLAADGLQVRVLASDNSYLGGRLDAMAEYPESPVPIQRVRATAFGRHLLPARAVDYYSFAYRARAVLDRQLRAGDVVVSLTDPPLLGSVLGPTVRRRGARLINWWQDVFPEVAERSIRALSPPLRAVRLWRDRELERAAANVVLGERMRDHLASSGAPSGSLHVIPNWADERQLHPLPQPDAEYRARYGGSGLLVGYSGNLGRAHEVRTIVGAAELLRDDVGVSLAFVGGGHQRTRVEAEARKLSLANIRTFPYAPRADLGRSLSAFDIHLVSLDPEMEGLVVPSKTYAALAVGRPVLFVGDPDGEVARTVRQFDCGWVMPTGDSEALAALLRRLAAEPDEVRARGAAAAVAHRTAFTLSIGAAKWRSLLQRLSVAERAA
jgi:colanic acid biosynthesis glycosyl transferase WcaI